LLYYIILEKIWNKWVCLRKPYLFWINPHLSVIKSVYLATNEQVHEPGKAQGFASGEARIKARLMIAFGNHASLREL
jgi:hypothetical protein